MSTSDPLRDKSALAEQLATAALAFRGYNVTNLGRSGELLRHARYGPIVKACLDEGSQICSEIVGTRVRLARRVRQGRETTLRSYAEAIALIVAMEAAHVRLLREHFGIEVRDARLAFGYSLGELSAVAVGHALTMADVLTAPLELARDCAELARDVTMGVLFSRGPALVEDDVRRLCLRISARGHGVVGISTVLSPNSMLLLGQKRTVARFRRTMHELLPDEVHMRLNPHHWPPLHTPITWQRNIPNQAAAMLHQLPINPAPPKPKVITLVDGRTAYTELNTRDLLHQWIDHPQRLWDAMDEILSAGVKTVLHFGPQPNLIPATFKRLSANVTEQVSGRSLGALGLRAMSGMAHRPWLSAMLPSKTSLLRAPQVRQVIVEDWLLAQD